MQYLSHQRHDTSRFAFFWGTFPSLTRHVCRVDLSEFRRGKKDANAVCVYNRRLWLIKIRKATILSSFGCFGLHGDEVSNLGER